MRDKLAVSAGGPRSPWTIWVPSALGLVSAALLLAAYAAAGIMSTWDTPAPGRGWLGVGAAGQSGLAGLTVMVLIAGVRRPSWRRASAIAAWMIIAAGVGWFLLTTRLSARA